MLKTFLYGIGFVVVFASAMHAQVVMDANGYPQQVAMHAGMMQPGMMQPTAMSANVGQPYFGGTTQTGGDCGAGCNTGCQPCVDCCKYIKGFGGFTDVGDYRATDGIFVYEGSFDNGFVTGGALGRKIRPMINMEAEFCYRTNDGDQINVLDLQGQPQFNQQWDGEIEVFSGMTNYLFEGCRRVGQCSLYGGGGVGYAFVNADLDSPAFSTDINDSGFAYQLIAGVSRAVSCRCDLFAEYRYFAVDDLCAEHEFQTNTAPPVPGAGAMEAFDFHSHNVLFGLRLCF